MEETVKRVIYIIDETIRTHQANINLASNSYNSDEMIMEQALVIELLELKNKMLMAVIMEES